MDGNSGCESNSGTEQHVVEVTITEKYDFFQFRPCCAKEVYVSINCS